MIFTERKITVRKGKSSIDESVILYRGDFEVELRFTIMETKYRFKSGVNLVDSEKASHAQLALLAPDGTNVFTEIGRCEDGTAIFVLSKEMIDELSEVGLYSFQIRLFDYYRESRITIPPVEFGIEVREPIAAEDHINAVDQAMVGYSIAKTSVLDEPVPETFDDNGQYNKTYWETGDRISEGKLNKIEDALYQINQNEINDIAALDKRITNNFNTLDSTKANAADLLVEKKRIDAITSLGEGSTTGDAELIDGRIGADGTTYENIGTAIRQQVDILTQMVNPTTKDIYRNGTEFVTFVKAYSNSVNSTIEENTGEFYRITYTPSGVSSPQAGIVTDTKVDLTDVNYVYFDVSQLNNHEGSRTTLAIGPTKSAPRQSTTHIKEWTLNRAIERGIYKFDVSEFSGSYYISVHTAQTGSTTATNAISEVNLYGVWLVYDKPKELETRFEGIDNEFVRVDESLAAVNSHVDTIDSEYLNNIRYMMYDNGVERLSIGNGFKDGYLQPNTSGTLTKHETYMEIAFDGKGVATADKAVVTNAKIDVTDIDYINIELEMIGTSTVISTRTNVCLGTSNNATRLTGSIYQIDGPYERRTIHINVKNKTGEMYLSIHGGANALACAGTLKIYNVSVSVKTHPIIETTFTDIPAIYKEFSDRDPLSTRCMLYQEGVEDITIGGGIIDGYVQAGSTASVVRNEDHIVLNYNGNKAYTSDTAIVTSKKVNLAYVDYIIVDWAHEINSASTRSHVCVSNSQKVQRLDGTVLQVDGQFKRRIDVVNVKHVETERYISVHAGNNSYNGNGHMEVYGIYLAYSNAAIASGTVSSEKPKDFIPEYWKDELNDSINKITTLQRAGGNQCTSVGFITDIHWGGRTMYSQILMKTILNECNIPYYFDGGDVVRGAGLETKDKLISLIIEERELFADIKDRCLRVIGNHDPAYSELGGERYYEQNLTHEETYDVFFRPSTFGNDLVWAEEGKYFYVDDKMHKIRYIGLDSTDTPYAQNKMRLFCFRQTQINWLANVALNVPDNSWSVVLCSHYAPQTYDPANDIVNSHIVLNILKAFNDGTSYTGSGSNSTYPVSVNVDYTNKGGDVICWMYGHVHADNIHVANGITVISTEADIMDSGDNCTAGTITEHAFDIFTINKQTRTVNVTRVGFGEDRSFTY